MGTIFNALIIALMIDLCIKFVPTPSNYIHQIILAIISVITVGIGGGIYLVSNLGAGPRDGLMIGLQKISNLPIAVVRGTLEISAVSVANKKYYENINPIEQKSLKNKVEILNEVNKYLRSKDKSVKQVTANFSGEQKSIEIIRSGGETLTDIRPLVRFNVSVMLEKNGRKETGVYGVGGRQSYDAYLKEDNWKNVCDEALRIASVNLESKPAPAGEMKVVLGPGWPAILIHEAVGHGLEGDFNIKPSLGPAPRLETK